MLRFLSHLIFDLAVPAYAPAPIYGAAGVRGQAGGSVGAWLAVFRGDLLGQNGGSVGERNNRPAWASLMAATRSEAMRGLIT